MNITTKNVTTKVHTGTLTADDIKGVAVSVLRKQTGVGDATFVSSKVDVAADGSLTVEVVESAPEAPAASSATPAAAPTIAPSFAPGFAKT